MEEVEEILASTLNHNHSLITLVYLPSLSAHTNSVRWSIGGQADEVAEIPPSTINHSLMTPESCYSYGIAYKTGEHSLSS